MLRPVYVEDGAVVLQGALSIDGGSCREYKYGAGVVSDVSRLRSISPSLKRRCKIDSMTVKKAKKAIPPITPPMMAPLCATLVVCDVPPGVGGVVAEIVCMLELPYIVNHARNSASS